MGDFNGHIRLLGYQKQIENGHIVVELMNRCGLILLCSILMMHVKEHTLGQGMTREVQLTLYLLTKSAMSFYRLIVD